MHLERGLCPATASPFTDGDRLTNCVCRAYRLRRRSIAVDRHLAAAAVVL